MPDAKQQLNEMKGFLAIIKESAGREKMIRIIQQRIAKGDKLGKQLAKAIVNLQDINYHPDKALDQVMAATSKALPEINMHTMDFDDAIHYVDVDEYISEDPGDDAEWDAHWAREDGDDERADDLEADAEWARMDDELDDIDESVAVCEQCGREGCECKPGECDCEPVKETKKPAKKKAKKKKNSERKRRMVRTPAGGNTWVYDDEESVKEDLDPDGMGYYNVTVQVDDNYPDEVETAQTYDDAKYAAEELVSQFKKGRWEVKKFNKGGAIEWQIKWDDNRDEYFTVIRVEPTDDADVEAWYGESIKLDSIVEAVLQEYPGQPKDYYDPEDEVKDDDDDTSSFDDSYGSDIEDEELGLRFD